MKPTTAARFGFGKSFQAPSAAPAVVGAALIASGTSDTAETAWSPAAACLLPDILPVAGTLLSYGGDRQLAAGGTVTHAGALNIGANALTCGAITASGLTSTFGYMAQSDSVTLSWPGTSYGTFTAGPDGSLRVGTRGAWYSPSSGILAARNVGNTADAALTCGAITASGGVTAFSVRCQGGNGIVGTRYINNSDDTWSAFELPASVTNAVFSPGFAGMLQFEGTTSSYPAIKRSSTAIALRLADNSDDAALTCGAITASGATFTNNVVVSGGGIVLSANSLYFGSYAVHVRGATDVLEINNGTTGQYRDLLCRAITASGAIQETPTQSALNPTTTNIPSGKRQGWYNSTLAEFRDWVNIGGTLLKSAAYT